MNTAETPSFDDFELNRWLKQAIDELGFEKPTPIQLEAFPVVRSGKNVVGISQTGTGKTIAFMLPLLHDFKYSKDPSPRILILVPTRELVVQIVEEVKKLIKYMNHRVVGLYGGVNINTQALELEDGASIVVATPGRLYDHALNGNLKLKSVQKLVIDEVDVMLDLGFRYQLTNLFDILPQKRQNLMFSATMTSEIEELITDFFIAPKHISIAVSGTPLDNIEQTSYSIPNYYTKVNLLRVLLKDQERFEKCIVFVASKKIADRLYENLGPQFGSRMGIIHSNKSQNNRFDTVQSFEEGQFNLLIATDVIARGVDFSGVSHVISFDTPEFPENYMHRIGRTGRAEKMGHSILLFTEKEEAYKTAIEALMEFQIPELEAPEEMEYSAQKAPEERPAQGALKSHNRNSKLIVGGGAFHEKKEKNRKVNLGNSKKVKKADKFKKPKAKGDKIQNRRNKNK